MQAVTYSAFRNNLRTYLDKTRDDASPIMVTSKDPSTNVVVMNCDDYENLIENYSIQSNSFLVKKLQKGIRDVTSGKIEKHALIED